MNKKIFPLLKNILNDSDKIKSFNDILHIYNYDIDSYFINKFKHSIKKDSWIFLDIGLINKLLNDTTFKNIQTVLKILKKNFNKDLDYSIVFNMDSYTNINNICMFKKSNIINSLEHIFIRPECFKLLCRYIKTIQSRQIEYHYLDLERVFKIYNNYLHDYYKLRFNLKNKQNKNLKLQNKINRLELIEYQIEIRKKQIEINILQNNINKKQIEINTMMGTNDNSYNLYTLY